MQVKNLYAKSLEQETILKGVSFELQPGEVKILTGPNGSGKTTLAQVIAGNPVYKEVSGEVRVGQEDILNFAPNIRFKKGIFVSFQNPPIIEGVSTLQILKESLQVNSKKKFNTLLFLKELKAYNRRLNLPEDFYYKPFGLNASGGQKKKLEVLQILMLKPKILILDEIDSGLDGESLKVVADLLLEYKIKNPQISILLITHSSRLAKKLNPSSVLIMTDGKILKSGGINLLDKL